MSPDLIKMNYSIDLKADNVILMLNILSHPSMNNNPKIWMNFQVTKNIYVSLESFITSYCCSKRPSALIYTFSQLLLLLLPLLLIWLKPSLWSNPIALQTYQLTHLGLVKYFIIVQVIP